MTGYTKHLEDHERDQFAACGLIVIDGEELADWHGESGFEWVAPEGWRILTEPCDTCGGSGEVLRDWQRIGTKPCPDCVGGRRVVTLTATCPTCDGDGVYFDDEGWQIRCNSCDKTGVVALGRFTTPALLPVYEATRWDGTTREPYPHVIASAVGRPWLWTEHDGSTYVDALPGDLLVSPGQFIARPERVA